MNHLKAQRFVFNRTLFPISKLFQIDQVAIKIHLLIWHAWDISLSFSLLPPATCHWQDTGACSGERQPSDPGRSLLKGKQRTAGCWQIRTSPEASHPQTALMKTHDWSSHYVPCMMENSKGLDLNPALPLTIGINLCNLFPLSLTSFIG